MIETVGKLSVGLPHLRVNLTMPKAWRFRLWLVGRIISLASMVYGRKIEVEHPEIT